MSTSSISLLLYSRNNKTLKRIRVFQVHKRDGGKGNFAGGHFFYSVVGI